MFQYKSYLPKHTKRATKIKKKLEKSISLRKSKKFKFQPPDLKIDFLIDSGAESNIINIPTWNEIKILHPKLTPVKSANRLATAQDSTLAKHGKIQFFLVPTKKQWNKLNS